MSQRRVKWALPLIYCIIIDYRIDLWVCFICRLTGCHLVDGVEAGREQPPVQSLHVPGHHQRGDQPDEDDGAGPQPRVPDIGHLADPT